MDICSKRNFFIPFKQNIKIANNETNSFQRIRKEK